jgi:hypothetical protein
MTRRSTCATAASFDDEGTLHTAARTRDVTVPSAHAHSFSAGSTTVTTHSKRLRRPVSRRSLAPLLRQMTPTTLEQLDAVSLLDRVDTKFVLPAECLRAILPSLARHYRVLEVSGHRLHRYRTLYFDTPDFELYRDHHAGKAVRHKVRSRAYIDTSLSFLEIKSKDALRRTVKHRLATSAFVTELTPAVSAFLESHVHLEARTLQPTVQNELLRVTLVGKEHPERLTLDLNIQFRYEGRTVVLPRLAIAELKQSDADHGSPFMQVMQDLRIHPVGISKYCVGVAMLVPGIERDAFESTLATIESVTRHAGAGHGRTAIESWVRERRTTHDAAS